MNRFRRTHSEISIITPSTISLPHQHFEVGSAVKVNEIMSRELNQYVEPLEDFSAKDNKKMEVVIQDMASEEAI